MQKITLLVTSCLVHSMTLRALRLENLLSGFLIPLGRLREGRHRRRRSVVTPTAGLDSTKTDLIPQCTNFSQKENHDTPERKRGVSVCL
jgi:hypothetical protein